VARRSDSGSSRGRMRIALHAPSESEVCDLRNSLGGDEDVARLQIAMNDSLLVRGVDGRGERLDECGGLARRHRIAAPLVGVAPETNSIVKYGRPSTSPASNTSTMLGWPSPATVCASRRIPSRSFAGA